MNNARQCHFRLITNSKHDKNIVLTAFTARETLSQPFHVEIYFLLTEGFIEKNYFPGRKAILYKTEQETKGSWILFHGIIYSFQQHSTNQGLIQYRFILVPWLGLLSNQKKSRIFQQQTVIDIFRAICKSHQFYDYDLSKLRQDYSRKNYCVQYQENTLDFIQRLFSEADIFYYFTFDKNSHRLILLDNAHLFPQYPESLSYHHTQLSIPHVSSFRQKLNGTTGKIASRDHSDLHPHKIIFSKVSQPNKTTTPASLTQFYFPGNHETYEQATKRNEQRLAALAWQSEIWEMQTNVFGLHAGMQFLMKQHEDFPAKQAFWIYAISHEVTQTLALQGTMGAIYRNTLQCVSMATPFQPRIIEKPRLQGCHLATVIDEQQDSYSRIKVKFKWENSETDHEAVSCYLPVKQPFAGHHYGQQFIPRKDTEVVVNYLYGDIDRPYISGCLYNENNPQPFSQEPYKSGIKTRTINSTQKEEGNNLIMDDQPRREQILLQAQKDLHLISHHDHIITINNDAYSQIEKDHILEIKGSALIKANQEILLQTGNSEIKMEPNKITIKGAKVELGA